MNALQRFMSPYNDLVENLASLKKEIWIKTLLCNGSKLLQQLKTSIRVLVKNFEEGFFAHNSFM
jgi:hypothetical protein